ncbi:MAG: hypothetical protein NTU44_17055 [Bacteroidetes bacterium]|nr:hypothetical protein [Bacteroidota bacterium]
MRKLLLFTFIIPFITQAQSQKDHGKPGDPNMCKVIIYRERSDAWKNRGVQVLADNDVITTFWNGSWYIWECRPGLTGFTLDLDAPVGTRQYLDAGKVYFLQIRMLSDSNRVIPDINFVDKETARKYFDENRLRKLGSFNPKEDSLRQLKSRLLWGSPGVYSIGLQMGAGAGFDDAVLVTLSNGKNGTISAGGGTMFGLTGSYRFARCWDMKAELGIHVSSLNPNNVSNANATFTRLVYGISLRYSLPFAGHFRFSAGPGIAGFNSSVMNADLTKVAGGSQLYFYYKPSLGYYIESEMEYFFRSVSLGGGLKYYTNNYEISTAYSNGYKVILNQPAMDEFRTMNGSSLFLFWSFHYYL